MHSQHASPSRPWTRWALGLTVVALTVVMAGGEWMGWPWLVQPAARALSAALDREVEVSGAARARVHFWGGVRLIAPRVRLGAPEWAASPWLLDVREGELALRYGDLWRMARGGPLAIDRIQAQGLRVWLQRQADGRSNWEFSAAPSANPKDDNAAPVWQRVSVNHLSLAQGLLTLDDRVMNLQVRAGASIVPVATVQSAWQWAARVDGSYRGSPVRAEARSTEAWSGAMPGAMTVQARLAQAGLNFSGRLTPSNEGAVTEVAAWLAEGDFQLQGPSLAAVGAPLGVTLPTTAPFRMNGQVRHQGTLTQVTVAQARIGDSRLRGRFTHDQGQSPPVLSGVLQGSRLALADLGPAIGVPASEGAVNTPERVLPDRPFNLPSLRAMNADVRVDIREFVTGQAALQSMRDLKGRIRLDDGVLRLNDVSTRLAQGSLSGRLALDARQPGQATLKADLSMDDVQLAQWVQAVQRAGREPYVAGRLSAQLKAEGRGRSTAEMLGSLRGDAHLTLAQGQVSQLAVELAGLDVMEGAFELLKGDSILPVSCAQVHLQARDGVLHPTPAVLSTPDSTVWVDGQISLKDETMDLRARVAPKDFSLVTLRTPLRVHGPWQSVDVKVTSPGTWARVLGAAALVTVHPLAGLLPCWTRVRPRPRRKPTPSAAPSDKADSCEGCLTGDRAAGRHRAIAADATMKPSTLFRRRPCCTCPKPFLWKA